MKKFKPGDVVCLRSGGPRMTVIEFGEYLLKTGYLCQWFNEKSELKEDVFIENSLDKYNFTPL